MRGVKQLGLANLVFPGANHDRFEHICGVVESVERVFEALKLNADRRREREKGKGRNLPQLTESDRSLIRLAALLHDVGHGPFSHAIEPVIGQHYRDDVKQFNEYAIEHFQLDQKLNVGEIISVLIVLSQSMSQVLRHSLFDRPSDCAVPEYQIRLVTTIMGARRHGQIACLSAIVSGEVDADKLDYLARDALHSGMPVAFDTERLVQKLEIICCTADNLPQHQTENIAFAEESPGGQYFDLGIAASGVGALEQMLVGRTFLYDRLYHHHKVRAADAMAQRLLHYAAVERGKQFELDDLYLAVADDTMIRLIGGDIKKDGFTGGGILAAKIARALLDRELYVRAFAFRASLHAGIPSGLSEAERSDALGDIWSPISTCLADFDDRLEAEHEIFERAKILARKAGDPFLAALGKHLDHSHIIVDLSDNRVKSVTINVHAEDGALEVPNLFFDPVRWSQVYNLQKRTGYVFCPRQFVPIVSMAAKIYFFERWGYVGSDGADRFTKTLDVIDKKWLRDLRRKGIIDDEIEKLLERRSRARHFVRPSDLVAPSDWLAEDPSVLERISDDLRSLLPQGLAYDDKIAVATAVSGLISFVHSLYVDRDWSTRESASEADLQRELVRHFRARDVRVDEAAKLGGGEYDLLVERRVLIENKVARETIDPFTAKPDAPYQTHRYAIAKCARVFITVIGYVPLQGDPLEQTQSIRVLQIENVNRTAVNVSVAVPYGMPVPSNIRRLSRRQTRNRR